MKKVRNTSFNDVANIFRWFFLIESVWFFTHKIIELYSKLLNSQSSIKIKSNNSIWNKTPPSGENKIENESERGKRIWKKIESPE